MSTQEKAGPPLFGLPLPGVLLGALWIAGAFAVLFGCFISNHINKASVPAEELAIANAALAHPVAEAQGAASGAPQP
jgi:hypothetical protein